jgi:hypothetical protein
VWRDVLATTNGAKIKAADVDNAISRYLKIPTWTMKRLGLEPKRKDWRPASMARLPKQATKHFEQGRKLLKDAKGLPIEGPAHKFTGVRVAT